jgi:MFS-type transporter involved in bile tolerance (Atg22 family)
MNGIGAGGGGTLAGFLVGLTNAATGSYMAGFELLGVLALLGGFSLLLYGRVAAKRLVRMEGGGVRVIDSTHSSTN